MLKPLTRLTVTPLAIRAVEDDPSACPAIIDPMRVPRVAELAAAAPPRRYDPSHILWYFGAITTALAMYAVVAAVDPAHRGIWQLLAALVLLAVLAGSAFALLHAGWWVPGGVLTAAAVALVPLVGAAFERLIGVWPDRPADAPSALEDFQGAYFALAVATVLVGLAAFRLVRFSTVFVPVAVATIVAAQLLVPLFVGDPQPDDYAKTVLVTGGVLLLVGLVLDSSLRRAEAFWWHVFALLGVAAGLAWYAGVRDAGWAWLAILVLGAVLLLASAPLARSTWATYGVLGVYVGVLHYVDSWLGSWRLAALMVLVGLGLVVLGIALQLYARLWARFGRMPGLPPQQPSAQPAETAPPPEPVPAAAPPPPPEEPSEPEAAEPAQAEPEEKPEPEPPPPPPQRS
jgi:hypothetical protein